MSDTGKLGHNYLHRKFNGEHLTTIIDPHLNYIYVPAQEFINVASALMTQFEARDYTCENEFDHCVFNMPCDNVPNKNLDFYLHFFDNNGGEGQVTIKQKDLLFPSEDFSGRERMCHFGILKNRDINLKSIYLGKQFLDEYYAVFNGANLKSDGYLGVIIGDRNPVDEIRPKNGLTETNGNYKDTNSGSG